MFPSAACAILLLLGAFLPLAAHPSAAEPTPLYRSEAWPSPAFANVTAQAGVGASASLLGATEANRETINGFMNGGRGACIVDIDGDGDDDIYVSGPGQNQLFRNDGNFTFADITTAAGVGDLGYGMGCASADLDNDGDQDMISTQWQSHFSLWRNNGNSTFTNMTSQSGVDDTGPQAGVAIADFDNDGLLDFFLAEYSKVPDRVYRNLGGFKFENRTDSSRVYDLDYGFQPIAADYDEDGLIDVFVVNDFGLDTLWKNAGNFTFADVSRSSGADDPGSGMGGAWGDYDSDGDLDIFVTNYYENGLWENDDGSFRNVANASGVDDIWVGWGVVWFDFDHDADLDLYIANGNVEHGRQWDQPNKLFRNDGGGNFTDVSDGSGAETTDVSRGLALSDLNGDGYEDLYVLNVNCPALLLKNLVTNTNGWLQVRLEGTVSNRDGVGATVTVTTDATRETQVLSAGSSYLSSNSKTLTFGLGAYSSAREVIVEWPSGLRQVVRAVAGNQTVTVVEEDSEAPVARAADITVNQGERFALNGSLSTDNVRVVAWEWSMVGNGTVVNASGALAWVAIYTPGTYSGVLTARDPFGLVGVANFTVAVRPFANVTLDAGPDRVVPEGATVAFRALAVSSATPDCDLQCAFTWSFDDGAGPVVLQGPSPTHLFDSPGTYTVDVVVLDPQNATAADEVEVRVLDALAPEVRAEVPAAVDEDVPVWLEAGNSTDNDPNFNVTGTFEWTLDGRTGPVVWRGARVLAIFEDPGTFTLTLTVRDEVGNAAARTFVVEVRDTTAPTPDAGPDRTVLPGEELVLSGAASTDNDPRLVSLGTFAWRVERWGGADNYTGAKKVIAFSTPGLFRVELDVWDPSGNRAVLPDVMFVRVLDEERPVAEAGGDREVAVGEAFVLDGQRSTDNDPSLMETGLFRWEFQDGSQRKALDGLKVEYVMARPGTYGVRLTVTDQSGNSGAVVFSLKAVDGTPPVLAYAAPQAELEAGGTLVLNASGTSDNVGLASVVWRVEGPSSFEAFVYGLTGVVVVPFEGLYRVTVTASDLAGNVATAAFNVTVAPRAAGTPGPSPGPGPGGGPVPLPQNGTLPGGEAQPPPAGTSGGALVLGAVGAAGIVGAAAYLRWRARARGP